MSTEKKEFLGRQGLETLVDTVNTKITEAEGDARYIKRIVNPKQENGADNYAAVLAQNGNGGDQWNTLKYYTSYHAANTLPTRDANSLFKVGTASGIHDKEVTNVEYVTNAIVGKLDKKINETKIGDTGVEAVPVMKPGSADIDHYAVPILKSSTPGTAYVNNGYNNTASKKYTSNADKDSHLIETNAAGYFNILDGADDDHPVNVRQLKSKLTKKKNESGKIGLLAVDDTKDEIWGYKNYGSEVVADTLVERNADGYFNVPDATSDQHPVSYGQMKTEAVMKRSESSIAYINGGDGKPSYKAYTSNATPGTLVYRDGNTGRFFIEEGTSPNHPVNLDQLNKKLDKIKDQSSIAYINGADGLPSYKRYTSEATDSDNNTLVERNGQGYFNVKDATSSLHPVNWGQMDKELAKKVSKNSARRTVYITDPTGNQSYKTYVSEATPSSIAHRDFGMAQSSFSDPVYEQHAVTKQYADQVYLKRFTTSTLNPAARREFNPETVKEQMTAAGVTYTSYLDLLKYFVNANLALGTHWITNPDFEINNTTVHTIVLDQSNGESVSEAKRILNARHSKQYVDKYYSPFITFKDKTTRYVLGDKAKVGETLRLYDAEVAFEDMYEPELDVSSDLSEYTIEFWDIDILKTPQTSVCLVQNSNGNYAAKVYSSELTYKSRIVATNEHGFFNIEEPQADAHPVNRKYLQRYVSSELEDYVPRSDFLTLWDNQYQIQIEPYYVTKPYLEERLKNVKVDLSAYATKAYVEGRLANYVQTDLLIDQVYPIGSIYTSTSSTNPGDLPAFEGTTWVEYPQNDSNLYAWERISDNNWCDKCNMAVTSYVTHRADVHTCPKCGDRTQTFKIAGDACTKCDYVFGNVFCDSCNDYYANITEHNNNVHICQHCRDNGETNYWFADSNSKNEHIILRHQCDYCSDFTGSDTQIANHIADEHTCDYCEQTGTQDMLDAHLSEHCCELCEPVQYYRDVAAHQSSDHTCIICNDGVKYSATALTKHRQDNHKCDKLASCTYIGSPTQLAAHIASDHTCSVCQRVITGKTVAAHRQSEHYCSLCEGYFHPLANHKQATHKCDICGAEEANLTAHRESHKQTCSICGTVYASSLQAHMQAMHSSSTDTGNTEGCGEGEHLGTRCVACGEVRPIYSEDLCEECYNSYNRTCACGEEFRGPDADMAYTSHIENGHCPKNKPDWTGSHNLGWCSKCETWIIDFNNSRHYDYCEG